ncbi:MAG: methylated-DNA--[protein]-cysteine S-methyltransferase [Dongiaceae bacterium]
MAAYDRGPIVLNVLRVDSPIGAIECLFDDDALVALEFADCAARTRAQLERRLGPIELTAADDRLGIADRLCRYFAGALNAINGIPVRPGGTPFQQQVWTRLRAIPAGTTTTYGAFAVALGRPQAQRAVGAANGANPISIVVPCHRLIGSGARLTGYGGGLDRKRWLLRHEGAGSDAMA